MIQKSAESSFCGVLEGDKKRKCVWDKTSLRLKQNARTFFFKDVYTLF